MWRLLAERERYRRKRGELRLVACCASGSNVVIGWAEAGMEVETSVYQRRKPIQNCVQCQPLRERSSKITWMQVYKPVRFDCQDEDHIMLAEETVWCLLFSNPLHLLDIVSHEAHVQFSWGSHTCGQCFRCECELFRALSWTLPLLLWLVRASHSPGGWLWAMEKSVTCRYLRRRCVSTGRVVKNRLLLEYLTACEYLSKQHRPRIQGCMAVLGGKAICSWLWDVKEGVM